MRIIFTSSICLSAVFLFILGCKPQTRGRAGVILVHGTIGSPTGTYAYLHSYPDTQSVYGMDKVITDSCIIGEEGAFELVMPAGFPVSFDLSDGKDFLVSNLFACPGDEVRIDFKGKERIPEVNVDSETGRFNFFLILLADSFYIDPAAKHAYYVTSNYLDGQQYEQYTNERRQRELKLFSDYFQDDSLRREYREYALNTIQYGIALDRLMYVWKKRMKGQNVVIDPTYFAFLTPGFIQNPSGLNCPGYIRFLNLYIKESYERKLDTGELTPGAGLNPSVEKFKLAEQLLSPPYSRAVLYNIIQGDMHDISGGDSVSEKKLSLDSMVSYFKVKYSKELNR